MSEREELLARLAELEAETEPEEQSIITPGKSGKKSSPFDPLPEGWKPEPRYLIEKDIADDSGFKKIGDWCFDRWTGKREHRQAYPHPTYGAVGGKVNEEIQTL